MPGCGPRTSLASLALRCSVSCSKRYIFMGVTAKISGGGILRGVKFPLGVWDITCTSCTYFARRDVPCSCRVLPRTAVRLFGRDDKRIDLLGFSLVGAVLPRIRTIPQIETYLMCRRCRSGRLTAKSFPNDLETVEFVRTLSSAV